MSSFKTLILVATGLAVWLMLVTSSVSSQPPNEEKKASYWISQGRRNLLERIRLQEQIYGRSAAKALNGQKPKNLIFFLGDGLGLTTVTAGRIYAGEKDGLSAPESGFLSFEKFPFTSLAKTYTIDNLVTDSAAAATALTSGVKANRNIAGLAGEVQLDDCDASQRQEARPTNFVQWAMNAGKATGFVTTTRVTHATPSALYAHVPSREWETQAPGPCLDVASQLVEELPGRDIRLILGGGAGRFLPEGQGGLRKDKKNLIDGWLDQKRGALDGSSKAAVVRTKEQLEAQELDKLDYLLGLFNSDHLMYETDRQASGGSEPSLTELVRSALRFMKKYEKKGQEGYLLFVEGGKIDLSHHKNWAAKSMEEVYQFHKAVELAVNETSSEDTLIVVTADHSHGLTINGYAKRGTPILGLAGVDSSGFTYPTLMYASGPGHVPDSERRNVTTEELQAANYSRTTGIYISDIAAHGGEDVPVYARGPGAHLFTGVYDQTFIAHLISYVTCTGHHRDLCSAAPGGHAYDSYLMAALIVLSLYFTGPQKD